MSLYEDKDYTEEELKELADKSLIEVIENEYRVTDDDITRLVYSAGVRTPELDKIAKRLELLDKRSLARYMALVSGLPALREDFVEIDRQTGILWDKGIQEAREINKKIKKRLYSEND